MKWDVKFKDEDGNVTMEGYLNKKEVAFLLGHAINSFVAQGIMFNLGDPDEEPGDDDEPRFTFPGQRLDD